MKAVRELAELYAVFFRVGLMTFGGGYAILPVIERELIVRRGWITLEEVLDYYTIGQVTPGVIAVNTATFIGSKRRGVAGGITATLGFISPSLLLVTVIAAFIANFADLPLVERAFRGIRAAVSVLIFDSVIKMLKGVFRRPATAILFSAAFLLSLLVSLSPAWVVTGAGLMGFLLFRKDAPGNGDTGSAGNGKDA
ncbi:MAG: chromate transporter [Spirochaetaceae bacterium]|jgi:chromate transporter|nr:chromate transporter [Spirochaetaceae bacterium]